MKRSYNFCAGPAAMPESVLQKAQAELLNYRDQGLSIMEMSHRSDEFLEIAENAEINVRLLLNIPNDYAVLMLPGGASQQFAMIPMNFLGKQNQADYVCTGLWSEKAIKEAQKFSLSQSADIGIAANSKADQFTYAPKIEEWLIRDNSAYLHMTPNETIHGVEYLDIPQLSNLSSAKSVPLIADMSSTILSRPIDIHRFAMIYAGAQKNIGPAGITLVIMQKDLLAQAGLSGANAMPSMFNYQVHAKSGSMFNTPPTFAWYLSGLVFEWLLAQGGLDEMAKRNRRKSQLLYHFIDDSDFYSNPVRADSRSWMNIPFRLAAPEREPSFLEGADRRGLLNLQGHRSVGGMRASLYNAVPESAVVALIDYMREFEKESA